uniref:Uncharacterized protein n=1 Tax=Branchiostoma floridae TaxID=7739 RepID=C3ZN86_BRAFL|eukprot:XP_002590038.1 hypothetical protein BRAFLDRAFT_81656 [Branchiostoma floridae]
MDKKFSKDKPNPIAKAGLLSKTFFWWLNPLFKTGYKRTLQEDDMYNVLYEDSSQKQTEDLEREWQKELDQAKESSKRPPSLRWALFRVFGVKFLLLGLCTLLVESIRTTQPIVLAWLIDYFSPETTVTTTQAYLYVLIISAGALAHTVIHHPYMFVLMEQGWRMRVACCGLIFRKGFMFFNYLWIGPLEILTVTILLYRDLGPSCLAGLGFMLVQLALTSAIGKLFSKYRSQTAQRTDSRIRTMSEIISAMRVIKMYTWEKPFSEMVAKLRKHEIQVVIKAAMCRGLNMALSSISLRMVVFFTFVTFALTGNNLSAGVVFKSIGLYNILQLAVMTFIPLAVAQVSEALVSIRRIQDKKTSLTGFTINDVVRSGLQVASSENGVYAGDEDCYRLYRDVFDPIIKARHEEEYRAAADNWPVSRNGYNATFLNGSDVVDFANTTGNSTALSISPDPPNMHFYIYIFTGLTAVALLLSLVKTWHLFYITVQSSKNLHNDMFNAIIRAPIRFFDTNPVGRILNRFSKDIGQLDDMFPWTFTDFIEGFLAIFGIIVLAGIINPWVFIPTVPLLLLFIYIRKYYLSTSRDIKRLEGTTRSPVFSHLSATLQGLWTIRAFGAQESFQQEFDAHQDLHSEAWFLFLAGSRWMSVRIDFLASLFVTAVTVCSVPASQALDGGLVGLSVTYAIMVTGFFQWVVRQSAEVENLMTSAERVVTYTKLEPEAPLTTGTKPPRDWPQCGGIELEAASFSYSEDGPDVLKKLCAVIRPQEKIGIVGRTGAGKSSLMQMLFRMAEPRGTVRIDGVDVTAIGLHDLRKKISVIPQDPVLFSGSLRRNLDPFNDFTDLQLWSAIEEVQLKQAVNELQGKLESEMAESGTNFSVGQRQLVCLARALLRRNRILIIDEATANVDPRTDQLIQETIREKFKNCTVLTIAHRLNTVIDSDRIMVLQEGRVQELGESHALLQDRDGVFTAMVDQSGKTLAAELREAARQCYIEKHGTDQVSEDSHTALTLCNVEFLTTV